MLAPSWPHDGPSSKVLPRLAKVSTKALPLRLGFSKISTKALPQAFRRLIVRLGCSILLLSILKVVSFWCFFQLALSWQVFQNDLFKRSSQVVLVGSSFLKFHPFSCIAQAVLGCPSPSPHNDSGLRMLGACSYGLIGITIGSCSQCLPLAVALSVYLGLLLLLSPPFLIAPCHLALGYPSGSIDFDFFFLQQKSKAKYIV